jgi:hypothetical protein
MPSPAVWTPFQEAVSRRQHKPDVGIENQRRIGVRRIVALLTMRAQYLVDERVNLNCPLGQGRLDCRLELWQMQPGAKGRARLAEVR